MATRMAAPLGRPATNRVARLVTTSWRVLTAAESAEAAVARSAEQFSIEATVLTMVVLAPADSCTSPLRAAASWAGSAGGGATVVPLPGDVSLCLPNARTPATATMATTTTANAINRPRRRHGGAGWGQGAAAAGA